jgi:hypothetical protein
MSPAYTRPGDLIVVFERRGYPADEQAASDGSDAMRVALAMLHSRLALEPGDRLSVRQIGDPPVELPATSRASQYS